MTRGEYVLYTVYDLIIAALFSLAGSWCWVPAVVFYLVAIAMIGGALRASQ